KADITAYTVVVLELTTDRIDRRLGRIVRSHCAGAENELCGRCNRNVVQHAKSERRVADIVNAGAEERTGFVFASRLGILAIAFELPVSVTEAHANAAAESYVIIRTARRIVIEMRP